jgi:hypothetical protein
LWSSFRLPAVARTITQKPFQPRPRSCSHQTRNFRHPQLGGTNEQIQNVDGANRDRGGRSHLGCRPCFCRPTARSVARGRDRGWRRSRFGGGCGSIHVLFRIRLRQIRILWLRALWSVWRRSLLLIATKACQIHKGAIWPPFPSTTTSYAIVSFGMRFVEIQQVCGARHNGRRFDLHRHRRMLERRLPPGAGGIAAASDASGSRHCRAT